MSGHEGNDILLSLPLEMLCIMSRCGSNIMHNCTAMVALEMAVSRNGE